MTTIVCTLETMASDSMASDEVQKTSVAKIFRVGEKLVGTAGCYSSCVAFVNWLKQGCDPEMKPDMEGVYAMVLDSSGISIHDECVTSFPLNNKFAAVGSGSQAALAAMHCGKTPREAVKIAAKIDPSTGGRIVVKSLSH